MSNKSTVAPSFTLLIDPPGVDWHRSSEGFLYTLKNVVRDLKRVDAYEHSENEIHQRLTSIITSLTLITEPSAVRS